MSRVGLGMNKFYMAPTCRRQRFEICNIRCDDFVAVVGDEAFVAEFLDDGFDDESGAGFIVRDKHPH